MRHRCCSVEVIYLFLVLGWRTELWSKCVTDCTYQYFNQGMPVDSCIYCFFNSSSHTVPLPTYYLELVNCCGVASSVLVFKDWWRCFHIFLISLTKCSGWLPYIFIITISLPTLKSVYDVALFCDYIFVFWRHQEIFQSISSFKVYLDTIFATHIFVAFT